MGMKDSVNKSFMLSCPRKLGPRVPDVDSFTDLMCFKFDIRNDSFSIIRLT